MSADGKLIYHDILGNEPLYDKHNPILRGIDTVNEKRYLTDAFTDEAIRFIERSKNEPFFLYLAYNAVHSPLQGADEYMERMSHIDDIHRRIFGAMLSNMDDSVGAVLEKIHDCELEDDTLIIFLSDNGGPTKELTSSNLPLSGGKGSLQEGGIRIPFMMQWKGKLPAGQVFDRPVISLDIYATAAAIAGRPADCEKVDGVNLIPYLRGETKGDPHESLYWKRRSSVAVRVGDWKLLRLPKPGEKTAPWQLYNLADDISESQNMAKKHPMKVRELEAVVKKIERGLKPTTK